MMVVRVFVVLDLLFFYFGGILAQDPCIEHVILDEPTRSINYTLGKNEAETCDRFIEEGWYKVAENGSMATRCPDRYSCGTMFPIWLNGPTPDKNQTRTMEACSRGFDIFECCVTSYRIEVKNCVSFLVYHLITPPACPGRYCVDGPIAPCPPGESSDSGFVPCKPITLEFEAGLKVVPDISTYEVNLSNKSRLAFRCKTKRDLEESELDYMFDFVWRVDGKKVFERKLVPGKSIATGQVLHLKDWDPNENRKLGFRIMCSLRARENNTGTPSKYIDSEEFYAGVLFKKTVFHATSGEDVTVQLKSTVPVSCPERGGRSVCSILIELLQFEDDLKKMPPNCNASSLPNPTAKNLICSMNFDGRNWNNYQNYTLKALSSNQEYYTCTVRLISKLSRIIDPLWSEYVLPSIKMHVSVKRIPKTCSSYNDPHINTFKGRQYVATSIGEFVLYRNREKPLQVNTIHKKLDEFKNCAVMIKAGTDFFVVYGCDHDPPRWIVKHLNCQEENLNVRKSGGNYVVILPTGTKVEIKIIQGKWLNVYIHISPSEFDQTEGLCGSYDENSDNDFTDPQQFMKSWSVPADKSLFRASSRKDILKKEIRYCTCNQNQIDDKAKVLHDVSISKNPTTSGKTECGWSDSVITCIPLKAEIKMCSQYDRSKRETTDDVEFDVPLQVITFETRTENLDWKNGWTYEKAKNECISFAEKSKMFELCSKLENAKSDKSDLESCISDIKISGTTNYLRASLDRMKAACLHEIETNTTFWVPRPDNQFDSSNATNITTRSKLTDSSVIENPVDPKFEEFSNIDKISDEIDELVNLAQEIFDIDCPDDCVKHGHCKKGICVCNDGFTGDDCSIDRKKPPVMYGMMFESLCDVSIRACESVSVFGKGFYDSNTITCRISDAEVVGHQIHKRELNTTGIGSKLSFAEVKCPIAELRNLKIRSNLNNANRFRELDAYLISVSFDEQMFSEKQFPIIVYNSTCTKCVVNIDESFTCKTREDVCIVEDACHRADSTVCKQMENPNSFNLAYLGFALAGVVLAGMAGVIIYKRFFGGKERYSFVSANENEKKEALPLEGNKDNIYL